MNDKKRKLRLSGHQTFNFRYGWLEKGYHLIKTGIPFSHEKAMVILGVGKNMVDSIKYWCEMTGIVEEGNITNFANLLLDEKNGWDPYLEDDASLWLLHWKLMTNPHFLTSGMIIFSFLHKPEFSKKDIEDAILKMYESENKISYNILKRDIDCYLRTYCKSQRINKYQNTEDETFECPLQDLNLIFTGEDESLYRFSIGLKISLPIEVIAWALCDYFMRENKTMMALPAVLYKEFSPGQIFMLDENTLIEAVEELKIKMKGKDTVGITESAGIIQIQCKLKPDTVLNMLDNYYKTRE